MFNSSLNNSVTLAGIIPDYASGINIPVPTSNDQFIAPCEGVYLISYQGGNPTSGKYLTVNGGKAYQFQYTSAANPIFNGFIILGRGDVLSSTTSNIPGEVHTSVFYPLKEAK